MSVKFHASTVGNLLVGGKEITGKQLARISELEARKADSDARPLTAKMEQELADLISKRDSDFRFGATAMSYIRDVWLRNEYGYVEPVVSDSILKGFMCEDDSIGVLTRQVGDEFRFKQDETWENDYFIGTPDIVGDFWVEDVKTSWSLKTFMEVGKPDPLYVAQGQVYMDLTGRSKFRLAYCLVDTPFEMVEEQKKRFFFKFNCDEQNPYYQEAIAKVDAMHNASKLVPEEQRIKVFEFGRDDDYLDTLRTRVEQARRVYQALTLNGRK
jgi:hypothetical protein